MDTTSQLGIHINHAIIHQPRNANSKMHTFFSDAIFVGMAWGYSNMYSALTPPSSHYVHTSSCQIPKQIELNLPYIHFYLILHDYYLRILRSLRVSWTLNSLIRSSKMTSCKCMYNCWACCFFLFYTVGARLKAFFPSDFWSTQIPQT